MFRGMHFAPEGEPAGTGGAATAAAPVAPPVSAPAAAPEADPHWLPARLERERVSAEKTARAALLKEIGVADPAAAAKLVADEAARVEAAKSLELKVSESEKALTAERARVTALSGTVSAIATERMNGLTEQQRTAVKAIAGDDAGLQLNAIAALAPTWASAPAATQTAATTAATTTTVATTPPATTAPGQTAPAGTTTTSQPDHKAEYQRLKTTNPVQAAAYLNTHESKIYPRA